METPKRTPTGKTYEIRTFEQLINITTVENCFDLGVDFIKWLSYSARIIDDLRIKHPKTTKRKKNWDVVNCVFIWTDDGLNEINSAIIKNDLTGETITVKINKDE